MSRESFRRRSLFFVRFAFALAAVMQCTACGDQAASDELPWQTVPWERWTHRFSFGALDTPSVEVIGEVRQAVFNVAGELFVLDGSGPRVLFIGAEGDTAFELMSAGKGPGELGNPVALIPVSQDSLLILDRSAAHLQVLALGDGHVTEVARVKLPFWPSRGCTVGQQLFLLGSYDGHTLHEIKRASDVVIRSFESSTIADSLHDASVVKLTRMAEAADGQLFCSDSPPRIVHAPPTLGWVRTYSPDGGLIWQVALPGFVQPMRTASGAGVRYDINPEFGYANDIDRISIIGDKHVVVTVRKRFPRAAKQDPSSETIVLDLQNGRELGRFPADTVIVTARNGRVATLSVDLFPILHVWDQRPLNDE